MISSPIIERELRVQSRKPLTYHTRLLCGLAAILTLLAWGLGRNNGEQVFSLLHRSLAITFLILAPIITADTISREHREGTLGLLFLTPLTPRQIILSKLSSRLLRLFYFWLMMVPFLALPILMGGVSADLLLLSVALLLTILITSASAGMIASTLFLSFGSSLVWAITFAVAAITFITSLAGAAPFFLLPAASAFELPFWAALFIVGPYLIMVPGRILDSYQHLFTLRHLPWFVSASLIIGSILVLYFAIRFCSWQIVRHRKIPFESKAQAALRKRLLTPFLWETSFRRSLSRKLDRNPFLWLEYRTVESRAGQWFALFFLVLVEGMFFDTGDFLETQFYILCALVFAVLLKSAAGFQREKENGSFELILVAPITSSELVNGRLRAVTSYFTPLAITLVAANLIRFFWLEDPLKTTDWRTPALLISLLMNLFSVPAVGLFNSLKIKPFLLSLLLTLGFAVASGPVLVGCFHAFIWFAANTLDIDLAYLIAHTLPEIWWPPVLAMIAYHLFLIRHFRAAATKLFERRAFKY